MNILYFDTTKADIEKMIEVANFLVKEKDLDILVLPDFTYLQQYCSKETLIWWRDKFNELINEREV